METILKQALEKCGMTQKELADIIHVTPQAVSKWIKGESRPSVDNVIEINKVLGIDLIRETTRKKHRGNQNMEQVDLFELNDYKKAKDHAKQILSEAEIDINYSHSVYILCERLLTSVIGLTYHQMIHKKDEYDEIVYQDIFLNIEDYFDDGSFDKVEGFCENYLEYNFYKMGVDLMESFDEYTIVNHNFCQDSIDEWYSFSKAIIKNPASPIYNEFLVALSEIANLA